MTIRTRGEIALWLFVLMALARADKLTYTLRVNEAGTGTFNLYAGLDNDSFGLVTITAGVKNYDTLGILAPFATFSSATSGAIGFNAFRSVSSGGVIGASQEVTNPSFTPVFGFGQAAGDLEAEFGPLLGGKLQPQYGAPLLIATGTWHGPTPSLASVDGLVFARTSPQGPGFFRRPAQFSTQVVCADGICAPPVGPPPPPPPNPGPPVY